MQQPRLLKDIQMNEEIAIKGYKRRVLGVKIMESELGIAKAKAKCMRVLIRETIKNLKKTPKPKSKTKGAKRNNDPRFSHSSSKFPFTEIGKYMRENATFEYDLMMKLAWESRLKAIPSQLIETIAESSESECFSTDAFRKLLIRYKNSRFSNS